MEVYRSAYVAGTSRVKDELEEVLKGYLLKFHWSWPLSRDPEENNVLPLDENLSNADIKRKAAEVDRLQGVSSVYQPSRIPDIVQSIECWLRTRVGPKKTRKNSLRQAVAEISAVSEPTSAPPGSSNTPGETLQSNKDTPDRLPAEPSAPKKIDAAHVLLARIAGIDLSRNPRRLTDSQYWSKQVFDTELRSDFESHFSETGKSKKHHLAELEVFVKRRWEELHEDEREKWRKENETSHQKLLDFAQKEVLMELSPQECAE